ncbi:hypothetical protein TIFTF001_006163 [Ficus carica]|uniref:Uncharacterized protein n=1 Tax=Ficus carica TaxID=3494 RepID=A0AA87ZNP8_FICCA|nr:hypothetical protein TIFTF001_006163 [Ficus carica]
MAHRNGIRCGRHKGIRSGLCSSTGGDKGQAPELGIWAHKARTARAARAQAAEAEVEAEAEAEASFRV